MGLVEQLVGLQVCIDTAPIIYFVEKHPVYLRVVKPMFAAIKTGDIKAMTSTITLLEVLLNFYSPVTCYSATLLSFCRNQNSLLCSLS